jgi:hypothetical protein
MDELVDDTKVMDSEPTETQHWQLGENSSIDAYLLVEPGYRLVIEHLGGEAWHFRAVPVGTDS